ncbi:hypothetical protein N7462_005531 [Penicillium macrosclerotiorum]|uniref:uncharacterized protein n=1 Tax=Penicillium macrosclerotiorum TaxID=303699 RepID=UPI002547031F|nr:uncharacterized protein N7462_005531 [Penicillium macrosclerotiorum]KAJ5682366.1 hypothetical protein N7462_005531 [Penicillium macrosclerotiorum]
MTWSRGLNDDADVTSALNIRESREFTGTRREDTLAPPSLSPYEDAPGFPRENEVNQIGAQNGELSKSW